MKLGKRVDVEGKMRRAIARLCLLLTIPIIINAGASSGQSRAEAADRTASNQMAEAISLARHGEEVQALAVVDVLLKHHPGFVPGLKLKGMLLEDVGKVSEAAVSYETALNLAPDDSELLLKVGIAKLVKGHASQAIKLLTRRLRVHPHDEESLYYLAQAYHLNGDGELALNTIREAVRIEPNDVSLWQKYGELLCSSGDNAEALRWLTKAQQSDSTLARINFDLAVASFNNMDLADAVVYSRRETESHPNDLDSLALLAAAQIKLAQWSDAEANLAQLVSLRREDASFLLQLGHCQLELKKFEPAIDALNRSLQLDPTQVLAHFYLSRALSALGKTTEAQHEADLHREMMGQISFTLPEAEIQRESALSERARALLVEHREDEALRLFKDGPEAPSHSKGSPHVSVGAIYLSMGDLENASRYFNLALHIDSKTLGANTYLGIMALQQCDLAGADRDFEAELALDPNHPLAVAELGEVRYRQGRWADAASLIARSKTTIPSLLYMLCDSYFRIGKISNAVLTAESLAAYARKEPDVMHGLVELLSRNSQEALAQRVSANIHQ